MVGGCVLHSGQRGEVWCVSSTLCRYDIKMVLLLVRSATCFSDCVWVCVNVGGVVDVVEWGLFFNSRCVWVDCQFV